MKTRIFYACPICNSEDVCFDAVSRWNPMSQDFELAGTHDTATCQECGQEGETGFMYAIDEPDHAA